jgi:transcription antitermination factor NusG
MEGRIKDIDYRKGRATVILPFLGEARTIQLGIDLIDKI